MTTRDQLIKKVLVWLFILVTFLECYL